VDLLKILDHIAKNKHDPAMPKTWLLSSESHFHDFGAPVTISRQSNQSPMGSHAHEFVEIVIIIAGKGIHRTGEIRHEIRTGDVMVIHGKRSHAYEKTESLGLINVLLKQELVENLAKNLGSLAGYHPLFTFESARWRSKDFSGRLRLSHGDLHKASQWVDAIEMETRQGGEGGAFLAKAWLILLVGLLARSYGKGSDVSSDLDMRLGRVMAAIDQNPAGAFSLNGMATKAAMSERSFLRYFRKATGFSPAEYVIRSRIRRAEVLLSGEEQKMTITEVAFRCGFNDSNYFSRQFRRVNGRSPRAYRNHGVTGFSQ